MAQRKTLPFVESAGSFANARYRGTRMPSSAWVENPDERKSMYVWESIKVYLLCSMRTPIGRQGKRDFRQRSPRPTLTAKSLRG